MMNQPGHGPMRLSGAGLRSGYANLGIRKS